MNLSVYFTDDDKSFRLSHLLGYNYCDRWVKLAFQPCGVGKLSTCLFGHGLKADGTLSPMSGGR